MAAFSIRPVTPKDLPEIVRLCAEHAEYEKAEFSAEGKEAGLRGLVFGEPAKLFVLMAWLDDVAVGFCSYSFEVSTWDACEYAHMDCLFLRESARGKGIGEALVRAVQVAAGERGVAMIQWQTPIWNERAIRFYRRLGATTKDKLRCYLRVDAR